MAPLKFRAWHKDLFDGEMFYNFYINPDGEAWQRADEDEWPLSADAVIMQSTGLHDKNGKEIFEGDILESYAFVDTFSWVDGGYTFDRDTDDRVMTVHYPYEIIGNIYENPNILPSPALNQ